MSAEASSGATGRFVERARAAGLDPQVQEFPAGTRTAADAAAAIGCDVAAIVKSLVFVATYAGRGGDATYAGRGGDATYAGRGENATYAGRGGDATYAGRGGDATYAGEERPVLVLTSGANRVDEHALAVVLGATSVRKADADEVRAVTGYAIGGTPPLGHRDDLAVVCDQDLLAIDEVWAAAGTPSTVFPIAPAQLVKVTGGIAARVAS